MKDKENKINQLSLGTAFEKQEAEEQKAELEKQKKFYEHLIAQKTKTVLAAKMKAASIKVF